MQFQFYNCSLIPNWQSPDGKVHQHSEVHFALFGRDVISNETVAVTSRYCPYIVVDDLKKVKEIDHTHYDVLKRKALHGYTEEDMTVFRVYVPRKSEFDRVKRAYKRNEIDILDSYQTLELQLKLVLGLKPLDIVTIDCPQLPAAHNKHSTVQREYHVPDRLTAGNRDQFSLQVTQQSNFLTEPTIMSVDIEAYSADGSFPNANNSHTISICYSIRTLPGQLVHEEKLVLQGSERKLLLQFRKAILTHDPDLITGWNTHGFDWPYLLERAKRVQATAFPYIDRILHHKVGMWGYSFKRPNFLARVVFDAMHTVRTYKERVSLDNTCKPESYSLNYIAKLCLGYGKVDLSIPEMRRAYEQGDMIKVAQYCLVDAQLPLDILEHENLCSMLFQVASISGASLQQAFQMTNSSLVIASMAHRVHGQGYVYNLPKVEKNGKFQGAFVFDPQPGLYKLLAILDFAALYPSIIIGYNMCYTTIINSAGGGGDNDDSSDDTTTVDLPGNRQVQFTRKKLGLLPQTLLDFMEERDKVKKCRDTHQKATDVYRQLDSRQQAIKTINNSFYGLLGSLLPFGLQIIAEAVTAFGRNAIQKTQRYLEARGHPVRLMDTDSCGIELPDSMSTPEVSELCETLVQEISSEVFDSKLILEYEKQLRPCLIFKKKMYVGYDPKNKDLLIKGLSAKRRNIMPFVRGSLHRVLELLCREGDVQGAYDYVRTRFDTLLKLAKTPWNTSGIVLEDFALTSAIKHVSEYKGTPSLGFRVNQKRQQPLGPGQRIFYVYYYDPTDPRHNASKRKGSWMPGTSIDTVLPLNVMREQPDCFIDVLKVLEQHERELRQYFRAVSVNYAKQFDVLYKETLRNIKECRGCTTFRNFSVKFLNM
jgi:DNA polymerase elongation subunit (family B)